MIDLIDRNELIEEIRRRKEQVGIDEDGSFCSWADENTWMTLDALEDYIRSMPEESQITHKVIQKVIKTEREAVADDNRLLAPTLTTEASLRAEIFRRLENEQ